MNKDEFLRQLEQLLGSISPEERADAMAYYRSYFEDAGIENEASILKELESPQKVAQSILKDAGVEDGAQPKDGVKLEKDAENRACDSDHYNYGSADGGFKNTYPGYGNAGNGYGSTAGSYGSAGNGYGSTAGSYGSAGNGYGNTAGSYGSAGNGYGSTAGSYGSAGNGYGSTAGSYGSAGSANDSCGSAGSGYGYGGDTFAERNKQKNRDAAVAVGIIAVVLLSPIWGSILIALLSAVVGVFAALFGVALAVVIVMGVMLFVGVLMIIIGFASLGTGSVAAGICVIGIGFLSLGVGMLAVIATVWVCGVFVPWACQGIARGCKHVWDKRKGKKLL